MKRFAALFGMLVLPAAMVFAYSSGPPAGYAGDPPNSNNCTACHTSFAPNSGDGSLSVDAVMEYTPGETYDVTVSISDPGQSRWGFEAITKDGSNQASGTITVTDAGNTQLNSGYIEHTSAGTNAGDTAGNSWTFQWTAPSAGTGPVTLYVAGNAANNNGNNQGDYIYTTTHVMQESAGDPNIVVSEETIDFGRVHVGETESRIITVFNDGGSDLVLSGFSVDGDPFSVLTSAPVTINAGDSTDIELEFAPTSEGMMQGTFTIECNDPDTPSVQIDLNGEGWSNMPPNAFSLTSPADNSMLDYADVISFSWEATTDPDGDAVSYELQASPDGSFSDPLTFGAGSDNSLDVDHTEFEANVEYSWRVMADDDHGGTTFSTEIRNLTLVPVDAVDEPFGAVPSSFAIEKTYPNPFNPSMNVVLAVPTASRVDVSVFDLLGRRVATLATGNLAAGHHTFSWRPNTAAGVYIVRAASASGWSATRKVVFVK